MSDSPVDHSNPPVRPHPVRSRVRRLARLVIRSPRGHRRHPGPEQERRERRELVSAAFDHDFYLSRNPDVAGAGVDPLDHYLDLGWREGRDPAPWFSTAFYLHSNADVADAGINPLVHYLVHGRAEGREAKPESGWVPPLTGDPTNLQGDIRKQVEDAFDPRYYLTQYPDVEEAGHDPLEHYLRHGWDEGRNPTSTFSTDYYLSMYGDVRAAGINPFVHFVVQGSDEGRLPRAPGGWKVEALMRLRPRTKTLEDWSVPDEDQPLASAEQLLTRITAGRRCERLLIAVGHSDHDTVPGGVQLCMQLEERRSPHYGYDYLALRPATPLPDLATDPDPLVVAKLNGTDLAMVRSSVFAEVAGGLTSSGLDHPAPTASGPVDENGESSFPGFVVNESRPPPLAQMDLAVHSLLGHSPEALAPLCLSTTQGLFWLHDFFVLCSGYTLLRNDVSFCHAPSVQSNACSVCIHGSDRARHLSRLRTFMTSRPMTLVAPSPSAADVWGRAVDRDPLLDIVVSPHLRLVDHGTRVLATDGDGSRPVRIAFVGSPASHKGWNEFVELSQACSDADEYVFYSFGMNMPSYDTITAIPVHVGADDVHAMRDALVEKQIDVVIHWAIWPETFGFSAFEAVSAGAILVTNVQSGNVAQVAADHGGMVFEDHDDLLRAFADGAMIEAVAAHRRSEPPITDLDMRAFSFELLKSVVQT